MYQNKSVHVSKSKAFPTERNKLASRTGTLWYMWPEINENQMMFVPKQVCAFIFPGLFTNLLEQCLNLYSTLRHVHNSYILCTKIEIPFRTMRFIIPLLEKAINMTAF